MPWKTTRSLSAPSPGVALCASFPVMLMAFGGASIRARGEELFVRGNSNGDQAVDISDAVYLFNHLFLGGPSPDCLDAADANDDGQLDISDGVFLLGFLFRGGPVPPFPSPGQACPGADPTDDALDCKTGSAAHDALPSAEMYPVMANAPNVRQRSRLRLPRDEVSGNYRAPEGDSFVIVLEAISNRVTRAGFSLADPQNPSAGNPAALQVTSDKPLGDPLGGGVAAGENFAPWFFRDVDSWKDPIYLEEHIGFRVAGDGPLSPLTGTYRFTATVTDEVCATSSEAAFTLEVLPSRAPEIFAWIEPGPEPTGIPLPHAAGSGNARVSGESAFILVVEGLPNGHAGGDPALGPDPSTFRAAAMPAFLSGLDLTSQFQRDPSNPSRSWMRLDPAALFPALGNTEITVEMGTGHGNPGDEVRTLKFILEVEVSYGRHIQPVWNVNCTGCHEKPNPFRGLELVAPGEPAQGLWRNIVNVYAAEPVITSTAPLLVWPYFPERSYLLHKLKGTHLDPAVGGSGDRMPQSGRIYLPDETLRVIESWILQGAGNN